MRRNVRPAPGLLIAMLLLLMRAGPVGCAPAMSEGGFESPHPAAKLYAIQRAGERRDADAIPELIHQLNSDDPAVRMYAIVALEKITGERRGYSPYAPPAQRDRAVERWVEAFRAGELPTTASAGSDAPADRPPTDGESAP